MAKNKVIQIEGTMLKWARESVGLSILEAAEKTKIEETRLAEWEDKKSYPTFPQLLKLATLYKRPVTVFFLKKAPAEPPLPKDFRVLSGQGAIKLDSKTHVEIRKAERRRKVLIEMLKELDEAAPTFKERTNLQADVDKIAGKFRQQVISINGQPKFKNENDAFKFWKSAIEKQGVLVFQASATSLDQFRGISVFYDLLPIIVLNTKDTPRGKIFSLLHEYCHLLLQKSGIGNLTPNYEGKDEFNKVEVFCNRFAAEALLPNSDLEAILKSGQVNFQFFDNAVDAIAKKFQVSWDVVLRRLLDAGKISQTAYKAKIKELRDRFAATAKKQKGGFVAPERKAINYNGEWFSRVVLHSFEADKITATTAADYLGLKPIHFKKLESELGKVG